MFGHCLAVLWCHISVSTCNALKATARLCLERTVLFQHHLRQISETLYLFQATRSCVYFRRRPRSPRFPQMSRFSTMPRTRGMLLCCTLEVSPPGPKHWLASKALHKPQQKGVRRRRAAFHCPRTTRGEG